MGDSIKNGFVTSIGVTEAIMKNYCSKCSQIIVSSGYRPQHLDEISEKSPELAQNVQKFKEKLNRPLSLEQLAANVIRPMLKPNTVVGAKKLVDAGNLAPGHTRKLTLDLTEQDFKSKWCNCCDYTYNYLY